jgi:hypothetical protein
MFACRLDCLIGASGEFDPLPDTKGFGYSRPTTSSQNSGRGVSGQNGVPSLGWLPVPHSRHSTVELAIGTCRHPPMPMVASGRHQRHSHKQWAVV